MLLYLLSLKALNTCKYSQYLILTFIFIFFIPFASDVEITGEQVDDNLNKLMRKKKENQSQFYFYQFFSPLLYSPPSIQRDIFQFVLFPLLIREN